MLVNPLLSLNINVSPRWNIATKVIRSEAPYLHPPECEELASPSKTRSWWQPSPGSSWCRRTPEFIGRDTQGCSQLHPISCFCSSTPHSPLLSLPWVPWPHVWFVNQYLQLPGSTRIQHLASDTGKAEIKSGCSSCCFPIPSLLGCEVLLLSLMQLVPFLGLSCIWAKAAF